MKNVSILFILFYFLFFSAVYSQQFFGRGEEQQQTAVPQIFVPVESLRPDSDNLQLAISSRDYPVTPGDVYVLSFIMAGNPVSNTLLVESDYTINMDVLGKIDAANMTFPELKPVIELIIADAYPHSMPSLTIQSIGSFQVAITGSVSQTQYATVWGLSRLSSVIPENITTITSIRDILITSFDGTTQSYDLLKAFTLGDLKNDPFLKPGDTIKFLAAKKVINVLGEVVRPGKYQLIEGETSKDLLMFIGGLLNSAEPTRIKLSRLNGDNPETYFVNLDDLSEGLEFFDGDLVVVNPKSKDRPIVYIEGAIILSDEERSISLADSDAMTEEYNRIDVSIGIGDTLYDLLEQYKDIISNEADLLNGYLIRNDSTEALQIDMQKLLYSSDKSANLPLKPFDRIAIPLRRPYVTVVGAVNTPGRFPYNPSRDAFSYINLAGGFDETRNSKQKFKITDENGNIKNIKAPIIAGDIVTALSNNFWYNFSERFGPITTAALFITSAITLINVLNNSN